MAEINRLYGKGLYDAAAERGNLDACLDQAVLVRDMLKLPEVSQMLLNPLVPKGSKFRLLQKAFSDKLIEPLGSYLELLLDKNREEIMLPSLTEFLSLGDRWRGIVEAHVVSAMDLRPEQVEALQGVLARKLDKKVDMTISVDPSLIGGFQLNVEGYAVDCSVRQRLQDMKHSIERGEGFDGPQT